jgi:hypothetical protein
MTSEQEAQLAELTQNWLNGNRGDVARELYKSPAMVARWCNYVSKMKGFEGDIETLANLLEFLAPTTWVGVRVHINRDDEQWGRIASDGTILQEVGKSYFLVSVDYIRANVLVRRDEITLLHEKK